METVEVVTSGALLRREGSEASPPPQGLRNNSRRIFAAAAGMEGDFPRRGRPIRFSKLKLERLPLKTIAFCWCWSGGWGGERGGGTRWMGQLRVLPFVALFPVNGSPREIGGATLPDSPKGREKAIRIFIVTVGPPRGHPIFCSRNRKGRHSTYLSGNACMGRGKGRRRGI